MAVSSKSWIHLELRVPAELATSLLRESCFQQRVFIIFNVRVIEWLFLNIVSLRFGTVLHPKKLLFSPSSVSSDISFPAKYFLSSFSKHLRALKKMATTVAELLKLFLRICRRHGKFLNIGEGLILRFLLLKRKGEVLVGIDIWLYFIWEGTRLDK